jgi:hypothetical protein
MTMFARGIGSMVVLALGLTACGGGGGNGTTTPSTTAISNLSITFGGPCVVADQAGTVQVLKFSFVDPEGDVSGGLVSNTKNPDVGTPFTVSARVPSDGVTLSGTTSGTITVAECTHFGAVTLVTERVTLFDAAAHQSNELTITVGKPGGAPEVPQGGLSTRVRR